MTARNDLLCEEKFKELEVFINSLEDKEGTLIECLHKAQSIFGYLPLEVQKFVGRHLNVPTSKVYGVVSFYSYFTMVPKGKYQISVCTGTACYVKGAQKVVDEFKRHLNIEVGNVTEDGSFSLDTLRCVGACGLAPVVMVNEKVYGHVTPKDVAAIIDEYK